MAPKTTYRKGGNTRRARLYSVVFAGKLSGLIVFLLFTSFMIQPFHKAFASEAAAGEEPADVVAGEVRPQEEVQSEETPEAPAPEQNFTLPDTAVPTDDLNTLENETNTETNGTEEGLKDVPEEVIVDIAPPPDVSSTSPDGVTDVVDEITPDVPTDTGGGVSDIPDVDALIEEELDDADPEIKKLAKETFRQLESLVNDQNYYQFSRQACVSVGNGAYHCTVNDGTEEDSQSVVYADRGAKGNLDIFLKTSLGKVKQITENDFEDSSPHYDPKSKRVVWQRLINDRYQIIMYDINEDKEYQLTFSKTNNMEPKVSNDGIVWQAWDENDWEIMYFDGSYTEQITDNTAEDVAPVIEDGYILWSVLGKESQEARVYSIEKGEALPITGHEGGSIVNPRFVLVYDTKFENGDIITQGFDPTTGLSAPIAAQPAPEPIDIPTPDPIGEIRALLSNKSSHEDEFVPDDTSSSDIGNQGAASSTADTLNLKSPADSLASSTAIIGDAQGVYDNFELTEYDLPIVFQDLSQLPEVNEDGTLTLSATSSQR